MDTDSSKLTTMATPFRHFKWRRLPFGVSPALEIFQQKLDELLSRLEGVRVIADDILVVGEGSTIEEAEYAHDKHLRQLLDCCRERGLVLNTQKLKFREREVPYVGHVLSGSGLQAFSDKVRAICNMPRPGNMGDVRRCVGMANYLARFLPALSGTLEPLHQLTNKDIAWQWNEEQVHAFCKVKEALAVVPVL